MEGIKTNKKGLQGSFLMKYFWVIIPALLPFALSAQDEAPFEGTFKYDIRVYGKDAQSFLLSEPAKVMTLHIKEDNFIVHLSGGRAPKTFLYIGDSSQTYIVDLPNDRAFRKDYYQDTVSVPPAAIPTGKTEVIHGVTCEEYRVKREDRISLYYVSYKYHVDLSAYQNKSGAQANFLTEGLEGRIPLKIINKTPTLRTEVSVSKITPTKLDEANFRLPPGTKIKGRDHRY